MFMISKSNCVIFINSYLISSCPYGDNEVTYQLLILEKHQEIENKMKKKKINN